MPFENSQRINMVDVMVRLLSWSVLSWYRHLYGNGKLLRVKCDSIRCGGHVVQWRHIFEDCPSPLTPCQWMGERLDLCTSGWRRAEPWRSALRQVQGERFSSDHAELV